MITGYAWAMERDFDVVVRMDGDGQMNPKDLDSLIEPVVTGAADFAKGNRFFSGKAYEVMPKLRFLGTAFLSLLTKIVSGYWHLSDFQSGYVAISRKALETVDWQQMYKKYGQPNDQLILLNVYNFRVQDIPVDPVYHVGEVSGIKIKKVIFTLGWLLMKRFFWRLKEKYIIRDFHPLVFFYAMGLTLGGFSFLLFLRVFYIWGVGGNIPTINAFCRVFRPLLPRPSLRCLPCGLIWRRTSICGRMGSREYYPAESFRSSVVFDMFLDFSSV